MSTPSAPGRTASVHGPDNLSAARRPSRPRLSTADGRRHAGSAVVLLAVALLVAAAWIGLPSQRFDLELSAGRARTDGSTTDPEPSTTTPRKPADRQAGTSAAQGDGTARDSGTRGTAAEPARTVSVSGRVPAAGTTAAGLLLCLLVVRRRRRWRLTTPGPPAEPQAGGPPGATDGTTGDGDLEPPNPSKPDTPDEPSPADPGGEERTDAPDPPVADSPGTSEVTVAESDAAPGPLLGATDANGGLRARQAGAQVTFLERRSARRVDVDMAADVHWSSQRWDVVVVNLSLTGAACTLPPGSTPGTPMTPEVGDRVDLRLPLPGRAVDLVANVQWVRMVDSRPQMGLLFVDVAGPARQQLRQFMRSTETSRGRA